MTNEYVKKSTDLSDLLPVRIRDKTLTNVIQNLFNRFLTKNESSTIFGYVGTRNSEVNVNDVYIPEISLERSVNTLIPTIYTKHATTEHVLTWNDISQKLGMLGVNTDNAQSWAALKQFNWVPPIDLDKFCNFKEYFWLGPWVRDAIADIASDWSVRVYEVPVITTGVNTGDGTLENLVIDDEGAQPEVWTITAVTQNRFSVVGSVSGVQSDAIVNYSYSNGIISFTVENGITDFAVGDSFTFTVIRATTFELIDSVISFEIKDKNYITAVDEVWTLVFNNGNVSVSSNISGFDCTDSLDNDGSSAIESDSSKTRTILSAGTYLNNTVIKIVTNRASNPYVTVFQDILGVDNILKLDSLFDQTNPEFKPEYYVINKTTANVDNWNDWQKCNLWVHREDVITFLQDKSNLINISFSTLLSSTRPIISYSYDIQINERISSTGPVSNQDPAGMPYTQRKKNRNQIPLFDLFYSNGVHARKVSPIFFYAEGNNFNIDPELERRLEIDDNADFIFEQGLINNTTKELYFYKTKLGDLKTIWIPGDNLSPDYVKEDITGSFINVDKFQNFSNYYWVGHLLDVSEFPFYYGDQAGEPEYTCIAKTGEVTDNDWQKTNYWVHITQLDKNNLSRYIPAVKPIIEFNSRLNPSLLTSVKSGFDQKPQYKLYTFNDVTDEYDELLTSVTRPFHDDLVAFNYLLIKNDDLSIQKKLGNEQTFEIYSDSMFQFNNTNYVQSLKNFFYDMQDYGGGLYFKHYGDAVGASITEFKIHNTLGLQEWSIRFNIDQSALAGYPVFDVIGSKTGVEDTFAHQNVLYSNGMISFKVATAAYTASDSFAFKFISSLTNSQQNFVKFKVNLDLNDNVLTNYIYKTAQEAIDIINYEDNVQLVQADVTLADGVLKTPPPLEFNLNNENRNKIPQGDLVYHFASIIGAQQNLVGQPLSANNYRKTIVQNTLNLGNGGNIKQFNSSFNLFVGLMNQNNVTPLSLIEFCKIHYANLQNQATDYALNYAIDHIANGTLTVNDPGWIETLFESFKTEYLTKQNDVVLESDSVVDNTLSQMFYDSSSPLPNTIITLPQLGLIPKVVPSIQLDNELGIMMLIHHDGHKTKLYNYTTEQIKKYILKNYIRSNGQKTAGTIGAQTPARPFMNQFWFDTKTSVLKYYDVVSDTGEELADQTVGKFSYDRANNYLKQWDGSSWIPYGNITEPWTEIPSFVDDLILRVEQELYNRIPPTNARLDNAALEADPEWDAVMETQFNDFGVKYNIYDIYDNSFNPENAFTWNYSQATLPVVASATWQDIYVDLYGTSRPDLYPWITVGMTQSVFYTYLSTNSIVPFSPAMWTYVKANQQVNPGGPISIDLTTGKLMPPFVTAGNPSSGEALLTVIPAGVADKLEYGDGGLIERVWQKSIEFNYDKAKAYFKLDPINFVDKTWGYYNISVNDLDINRFKSKKLTQLEFTLHNERKETTDRYGNITIVPVVTAPSPSQDGQVYETYYVEVVNRLDSIYRVTRVSDGVEFFHSIGSNFSDAKITSLLVDDITYYKGLSQGDKWIVTLTYRVTPTIDKPIVSATFIANPYYSYTGLNQIYVQQIRQLAANLDTALNVSLLRNYDVMLGYRTTGFIDNALTTIKADTFNLDNNDWKTLIKENKLYDEFWVHALRIQIVNRGTVTTYDGKGVPGKSPGDADYLTGKDWVFRVETFNKNKAHVDFYEYDLNGEYDEFYALNQKNSLQAWRRYKTIENTRTEYAPFLVTGIQALIDFLFGYSKKLKADGWQFYDPFDPVVDPTTGRIVDWDLDIEYFIDFLFRSTVLAGTGYIMNPFKNSVWITTDRGQIADLTYKNIYDFETSQSVINAVGNEIKPSNIRVFRNNEKTEIICDEPMYGLHLTSSEYEHIIVFNNYASNINLVYDAFLGQKIYRFHIVGQKQVNFNGRPSFGGRFLLDNEMRQNLESSVEGVLNYYDVDKMLPNTPETDRARGLLGYDEKQYFADIGLTDQSAFRFWQGMLPNKGSNLSLNAFSNQAKYENVLLDEYWAFKVAEYGDMGQIKTPEIKVNLEDIANEYAHFKFIEDDESDFDYGYDIFNYNIGGFGSGNVLIEQDDIFAWTRVTSTDEKRWYTLDDLGSHQYFNAELLAETYIIPISTDAIYSVVDNLGREIHADCFEIVRPNIVGGDEPPIPEKTFRETGEYNSTTDEFTTAAFTRINSSTIKINDSSLLGYTLKVKCYGRPNKAYGPMKVIDYKNNVITRDDITLWDPIRGIHNYRAIENVDIKTDIDPARYNQSLFTTANLQYEPSRPWEDNHIGKIWWDMRQVDWKPYHDTKRFRSILDRIYNWGALADYSRINVYQWIESPVPPSEYETYVASQEQSFTSDFVPFKPTGKPLRKPYQRTRTWQHRTVAWKYSDNVCNDRRKFITGTEERIIMSSIGVGPASGYLTLGRTTRLGFGEDYKFSNAIWTTTDKLTEPTAEVTKVYGESLITGESTFVVGSGCIMEDGGIFTSSSYFDNFKVTVDSVALRDYIIDVDGQISFDKEFDATTGLYYIKATNVRNNRSQRIQVIDTPVRENTTFSYRFDELGITFSADTKFAHTDNWTTFGSDSTDQERIGAVAFDFGNVNHDVFIRESFPIFNLVPYKYFYTNPNTNEEEFIESQQLYSMEDDVEMSWIAWKDPEDLDADDDTPMNKWEAVFGDYVDIGPDLQTITGYIIEETENLQTITRLELYKKYNYIWNDWQEMIDYHTPFAKFYLPIGVSRSDWFEDNFVIPNGTGNDADMTSISNRPKSMNVYVNKKKLIPRQWSTVPHPDEVDALALIMSDDVFLRPGDFIECVIEKYRPTQEELEFDPDNDPDKEDPMKLYQFKYDHPHVKRDQFTEYGYRGTPKYYFWVSDTKAKVGNKKLSTSIIANLLFNNTDSYSIIQGLKYYNPIDGRPNRYSLLSLKNLSHVVGASNVYKLRLTTDFSLRDKNTNLDLKNVHTEWIRIREQQSSKIPRVLWDSIINSMCAENVLGEELPSYKRQLYDLNNGTKTRYGFSADQVLADGDVIIATVRYTILNTRLNKYINPIDYVSDTINFQSFGYDINNLDTYLSSTTEIRKLMEKIWNYANAKQVNEIFFAVLNDALSQNKDMKDIFKTSVVAMQTTRVVDTDNITGEFILPNG